MTLKILIARLEATPAGPARARELAHLAFIEWLGSLPGEVSFPRAAEAALRAAARPARRSRAVAAFRALVAQAAEMPPRPLGLALPAAQRRGGAKRRRLPF
jgi:hypothetical protein